LLFLNVYVLFGSSLKISNLASIEMIWLFFWFFICCLYVLFAFSLNFFQLALHSNYLVFFAILLFNFCIYLIYFICIVRSGFSDYRYRVMAEMWTLDCVCLLESSDFKECDTQVSPFPKTLECPVDTPFHYDLASLVIVCSWSYLCDNRQLTTRIVIVILCSFVNRSSTYFHI